MSIETFIPAKWAGALLSNLNDAHVYAQCANSDYEGDLEYGGSVRINSISRPTISDYTRNQNMSSPETLDMADQIVLIDQAKSYHWYVDDIDKRQARGEFVSEAMGETAWAMADTVDSHLASKLSAGVASANVLTAATVGMGAGEANPIAILEEMGVLLDDNNTPGNGRWVVVPNWFHAMLRLREEFSNYGTDKNRGTLRGQPISDVAGFTVYKSNNVPTSGSAHVIIAGYKGALTYAQQIKKSEAYSPELRFGDAYKGLMVYGSKVTRPSNLVKIVATKGEYS